MGTAVSIDAVCGRCMRGGHPRGLQIECAVTNKKLLVAPGITTRNKNATRLEAIATRVEAIPTRNKKLLVTSALLVCLPLCRW